MSFSYTLKYQDVVRKPNPMATLNPLARGTGKIVSLQDRVDTLNKSFAWQKTVKEWKSLGKTFNMDRRPKVKMVRLGDIDIDEDIQRQLDDKHCANKIANPIVFDEALLQTLQCILPPGTGRYTNIDGQHTASTISGLIDAGLMAGYDDWRDFEVAVQYIETDNKAFARRAFSILNGCGKKKQSAYQQLRNSVFIIRIDKDTSDSEDVDIEAKVATAEKYNCYPVEVDSPLAKYPGTFTNIATFKTLNKDEIELACAWHDQYFHYEGVHVSLFFIFRDLCRDFGAAKLPVTDKLQVELAALVQTLFGNLSQFQESVTEAHRKWTIQRYGYQAAWDDDAYACALIQLYKKFGGTEKVAPTLQDRFDGLIDFFDTDILALAA